MKTIGIIGLGADGGTFLDWTLHFLSGSTQYYWAWSDRQQSIIRSELALRQLVTEPIKNLTAHYHVKNHANQNTAAYFINNFLTMYTNDVNFGSFYLVRSGNENTLYSEFVQMFPKDHPQVKFIILYSSDLSYSAIVNRSKKLKEFAHLSDAHEYFSYGLLSNIDNTSNSFHLDVYDVYNNLPTKLNQLFEYLDLRIDDIRYNHWLDTYFKWQQLI